MSKRFSNYDTNKGITMSKNNDMDKYNSAQKNTDIIGEAVTKADKTPDLLKLLAGFRESKLHMSYIKPEMLPDIDLYMDQVTTFMDTHLSASKRYKDDKILTKTMINNYAKNNLLPPPEKKKYSKDHLLLLTFIYYLKSMLSMNDIQSLLEPVKNNFFQNPEQSLGLEDIYREVFHCEEDIQKGIMDDILSKYEQSRKSFLSLEDNPEQQPALQDFTFVCMLCYDIFLKKQLVEQIIDTLHSSSEDSGSKKH